jgi:hypothetical protein
MAGGSSWSPLIAIRTTSAEAAAFAASSQAHKGSSRSSRHSVNSQQSRISNRLCELHAQRKHVLIIAVSSNLCTLRSCVW